MASYSDILFGRIVLKNRLATFTQVDECLKRAGPTQSLGEALVAQGLLRTEHAQKVQRAQALMQFMRAERTFARILLERRLVDMDTLRKCFKLQEQNRYKVRIAQLLVDRKIFRPEQLEAIVDQQLLLLAEETTRIEEQGLSGAMSESTARHQPVDKISNIQAIEDLDSSATKKAVGPKGLFDTPSRELIRRTLPMMKTARLDEPAKPSRDSTRAEPLGMGNTEDGLVGRTIASRYRILCKVGEGGMGTVYKAEHCLMEKIVALKVLHPSLLSSKASLDRFRIEIRAASRFQHKNVIQIYDAGEGEGGIFYMAMEFAEGETLEERIQREGALSVDTTLLYLRQALRAVGEAHKKNIVHRDLKSGNFMLSEDKNGEPLLKVMDFGIAKIAFEEDSDMSEAAGLYRTQEGIVTGTPQYMSPEQASGEHVDHRSDLYSLGVILFEMLTGELPFKSNTPMGFLGKHIVEPPPRPSSVKPGLPVVLEEVTLKLLEKDPNDRYQSAEQVLADLDLRCSGEQLKIISSSREGISGSSRPPALTVAVAPPKVLAGSEPTAALPAVGPAPVGTTQGKPWTLIAGLIVLLLLVVSASTTLVIVLSKEPEGDSPELGMSLERALKDAEILLRGGDPAAALKLLQLVPKSERTPRYANLVKRASEDQADVEEASRLAESADELAESFSSGTAGREAAEEAVRQYRISLDLRDDRKVRQRLETLEARLAKIKRPGSDPNASKGLALVIEGTEAIQRGNLDRAAERLKKARRLLPPDHKDVRGLERHLQAERLQRSASASRKAGRLQDARRDLVKARDLHPDVQTQLRMKTRIGEIEREIALAKHRSSIGTKLESSLLAATGLDLQKAGQHLAEAIDAARAAKVKDPRVELRREGLALLARFADQIVSAEDDLAEKIKSPRGVKAAQVEAVLRKLRRLRKKVNTLAERDPKLGEGLMLRLKADLSRATKLSKGLAALQEQFKSDRLKRFERRLAKLRKLPEVIETAALVESRLSDHLDLQERSSYVRRECSTEDRAWLDDRVNHYLARRLTWADLTPDGSQSSEVAQIPGGAWESSSGKTYTLPRVYYMGVNEVTCAEWARFMQATGAKKPISFPGPLDEPVRFLSLLDANRYCRWRSKQPDGKKRRVVFRLPTEAEWERAAVGPKGEAYPWGERFEDWRRQHAAVDGRIHRVRFFRKDKNFRGLWDLVGNVCEMTTLVGNKGKVILRGGSAASKRSESGATFRREIRAGDESSAYTGLRVLAVER